MTITTDGAHVTNNDGIDANSEDQKKLYITGGTISGGSIVTLSTYSGGNSRPGGH